VKSFLSLVFGLFLGISAVCQAADNALVEGLRPKKFVLAIGVGQFQSPLWHELRFARKDAEDMFRYFKDPQRGFDGGELLTDRDTPLSRDTVLKALSRLEQENRNEEDTVIVYVSSHGTVGYKEDAKIGRYIITSDTDPKNMRETAIDYDKVMELFQKLKSRKKVLILAFCHSGVGKSVLTPEMKRALAQLKAPYFEEPIQERSEGSIVLTASGWREPALEDERLQNDVYTYYLMQGFNQDRNGDGAISITEAHAFASQATYAHTKGRQRPSAIMELLGSDPVIVAGQIRKKDRGASLFSLMDRFSKLMVSIDGKDYGTVEKGISVPDGDVRLTIRDPETQKIVADRVVNFQAGREYSIANYLLPRLPHTMTVGIRTLQFLNNNTVRAYTPSAMQGIDLRYTYEEAFWLNDLHLGFTYYPEVLEQIEIELEDKTLRRFDQKRTMMGLSVSASRRYGIAGLSRTDRSVRTEARWQLGIENLFLQRSLSEPAFNQRDKSVVTSGLSAGAGIDATWAYHLLRVGSELRIDLLRNFTDEQSGLLAAPTFAVYVGTFW